MALVGFDPDLVSNSIGKVQNAYNDLMHALADDAQTKFVNEMQDKWACNQAKKFFESFKTVEDTLIKESTATFQSVVDAMNSAAKAWASQTESNWPGKQFNSSNKTIDVSCIQENIGGVRGVDPEANGIAANLTAIKASAVTALSSATSAVSNCGFVGGDQAASLINSLNTIKTNIETATGQITGDCGKAIQDTAETYSNLSVKVSDAFSGQ